MTPSHEDPWRVSWGVMHGAAWWYLNHAAEIPQSVSPGMTIRGLPRLQLWEDAKGFGCEIEPTTLTVYELFTDDDRREPVVREAVWQRSADLSRVHEEVTRSKTTVTFIPTVTVRDAKVPPDPFAAFLAEASAFRVPVTWFSNIESLTTDVGGRGFEFFSRDQPPASLRLKWSWDTPQEWKPVLDWHRRLWQFLESCLS